MTLVSEIEEKRNVSEVLPYSREEEYRLAQQAGTEAVMVGRETLATVVHQGEQLRNAENIVDDTLYTVDHANRLLRGMTWSGWLGNKFSKPLNPPDHRNLNKETNEERKNILKPLKMYDNVPEPCVAAMQSVQNYHLNLQVFENCETDEQKGTCKFICDDMSRQANLRITELLAGLETSQNDSSNPSSQNSENVDNTKDFALQLKGELSYLRQQQLVLHQITRGVTTTTTTVDEKMKLFNNKTTNKTTNKDAQEDSSVTNEFAAQEQHLNILGEQCRELGSLAGNISISAEQQAEVVDSLNTKNDGLYFKMNVMNRRTERFIKDKSWGQQKADFIYYASILHKTSGCYLSISPNNDSTLILSKILNEKSIFGIYKRGRVLGLQNKYNRQWAGQDMFGKLTCSTSSFNRRQEWEAGGDDWSTTTLLVVSKGWGAGGYLLLNKEGKGTLPIIGGGDFATKEQAPEWCISEFNEPH